MTDRADLPLPDYDHLPLATLQHRIRSLEAEDLDRVLAYERAHGDRAPVVTVVEERLRQLAAGAQPSGGDPAAATPEAAPPPSGGSEVSPASSGPKINPPSHGDPTNPAQPRSTG
ncbi:hypothetical protein [Vallicoccus soli]|uniref:DUF8129 domain-containing protein n=1 Tax=Vallicoccus soli TaxID=2339232 RepID=A0A3A3Z9F2_9ACTN|nr:hypothetical protein [Vallicoccus soli]RJK97706.1 hypothetical protein D5H78_01470 [Vallicoccus soli]